MRLRQELLHSFFLTGILVAQDKNKMEKLKKQKRSVGIKRIVMVLSGIFTIAWVLFVVNAVDNDISNKRFTYPIRELTPNELENISKDVFSGWWPVFIVGLIVAYFIPQLICKTVYWVLDGFKKDKEHTEKNVTIDL